MMGAGNSRHQRAGSRIGWLLLFPLLCGFFWSAPSWQEIHTTIARDYPEVAQIPAERLLEMQKREKVLLIDVREPEEYAVSHLRGAIRVTDPETIATGKDTPIVTYCSVGVRSSAFARGLMKKGYTRVYNLKDSIFGWANRGLPLFRGNAQVHWVHPYNGRWGKLLDPQYHQYTPGS